MGFKHAALYFAVVSLAACSIPTPPNFYQQATVPGAPPGTLISAAVFPETVANAAAYRVLYQSTDIHGDPIAVSGIIYIPAAPPPPGGRNIVAWAHPTTGIAPGCAPSLDDGRLGGLTMAQSIPGLSDFIAAGDIVTATDYPGLGTPGIHPYLVGDSEARSIIDSVRAARALPGAAPSGKYVVWGHSQGAQAALFTGQIGNAYAPDLHLAGIAAAAPPTDLGPEITAPHGGTSGALFDAYVYYSWSQTYAVPLTGIINPAFIPATLKTAAKCVGSLGQGIAAFRSASALNNTAFLTNPPQTTEPWATLFTQNSPGHAPLVAPALITQGTADTTVEPHYTDRFVKNACAQHEVIDYQKLQGVSHLVSGYKSLPLVTTWIASRFAGKPAPNTCH